MTTNAVKFYSGEWLAQGAHEPLLFSELPDWLQNQAMESLYFVKSDTDYVVLSINENNRKVTALDHHADPDHLYPGDYLVRMEDGSYFILKAKRIEAVPEAHRELATQTLTECTRISHDFLNTLFPI